MRCNVEIAHAHADGVLAGQQRFGYLDKLTFKERIGIEEKEHIPHSPKGVFGESVVHREGGLQILHSLLVRIINHDAAASFLVFSLTK
jgi:hypothetical protein